MDNYGFKNIAGYDEVKEELVRILNCEFFIVNNTKMWRGSFL